MKKNNNILWLALVLGIFLLPSNAIALSVDLYGDFHCESSIPNLSFDIFGDFARVTVSVPAPGEASIYVEMFFWIQSIIQEAEAEFGMQIIHGGLHLGQFTFYSSLPLTRDEIDLYEPEMHVGITPEAASTQYDVIWGRDQQFEIESDSLRAMDPRITSEDQFFIPDAEGHHFYFGETFLAYEADVAPPVAGGIGYFTDPVPEPATMLLLGSGLLGLVGLRRKFKK